VNAARARDRKPQRGAALILVLLLVSVFLILMGSVIDVLALESQSSIESADSAAAVSAAYSGVDLMILSIEEFYDNGIQGGQPPQAVSCQFSKPGGGSVSTSCIATIAKTWNGNGINYYLIRSSGSAFPTPEKEVDRQVVALIKQVPFGAYAHFSESEHSNTGGSIWYSSKQSFDGPVYSGGNMHIMYDSSSTTPIFPMGFTTDQSAQNLHWMDVVDGNNSKPNSQQEYYSVFGTSSPTFTQSAINLPGFAQNLDIFSEAFYGDNQHGTSDDLQAAGQTDGVYVNGGDPNCPSGTLCSGVFVAGTDVSIVATSVGDPNGDLSSGSQTWTISSPSFATTTVTVDFGANTTTVAVQGGSTKTYTGVASGEQSDRSQGNGALFVDGSLSISDGSTVHGQYTVAVPDPPINNEGITLLGSVTDKSDPRDGPSQDELALWADTVALKSGNNNPIVEAMVLTGYANECTQNNCGGWFANSYCKASGCNGGGTGTLTLYGSDIENLRGKMGTVDSNGDPVAGYLRGQTYDPRLGAVPPPFSPTTNLYSIVAIQDVGWGISPSH
jgi:hypothetical protein